MEMKELRDDLQKTFHEFKKVNDKMLGDVEELGKARSEDVAKLDKINNRLDEVETKMSRPSVGPSTSTPEPDGGKEAFFGWLKTGSMSPEHSKALLTTNDPQAGYLTGPPEWVASIIKSVEELTPLRQLARVMNTSSKSVQIPKRTSIAQGTWVAEAGTKTEDTNLTFGLEEISNHEISVLYDVSNAMLEDSAFNLESELSSEFAFAIAKASGTAFVSGNGVSQPQGILSDASIGSTTAAAPSAIDADSLMDAFYGIKDEYARNSSWLMRRATIKTVRQLKDDNNAYLWQPALGDSAPATILGMPYQESPDMPAEGVSNPAAVLFGDFKRCYLIVDRLGMTVQRDPFTQAASGLVRFIARSRVGGQVVDGDGLIKILCG
jgi:HK97 family phage major capsid protein